MRELKDNRRRNAFIAAITVAGIYTAVGIAIMATPAVEAEPEVHLGDTTYRTEEPILQPAPVQEDFENEKIEQALLDHAHVINDCTITYYCSEKYPHICNSGWPYVTKTGSEVVPYVSCAVDPSVIPLGSDVLVDFGDGEIHYYVATDTGGAIGDRHIDLAVTTHPEALCGGVGYATVYWVEPGGVQ